MPKSLFRSFAGGEITPEMFGRMDLTKYQTGLAQALNFITLPHGPAARRPGTQHVARARNTHTTGNARTVRLLPFVFSASQAYVLEVGASYVRFHNSNGTELETAKTVSAATSASPSVLTITAHGYTTGDAVFCQGFTGPWATLEGQFLTVDVLTADTVNLRRMPSSANLSGALFNATGFAAYTSGASVRRVYTLASSYTAADQTTYAQNNDIMTLCAQSQPARELKRLGAANWAFNSVAFTVTQAAPTAVSAVATIPTPTNPVTQSYVVTAVAADLVTESAASTPATCSNNLSLAGNFNTVSWTAAAGASRYYVYRLRGGSYGYIGQTSGTSLVDDNISPQAADTPPVSTITLNTGAGDYPAAVTYYERRRWFAGTTLRPQNVFATRNGTESNLTGSVPSQEDDALEFRIASQQQQTVRHLVALQDVVALTASGEHRIFADGGPALSLSTLSVKPQSATGASTVQPALSEDRALYVQAQGSYVRELAFDPSGLGRFTAENVSIMAPHLFDGFQIVELAYCRAPVPVLWALRSDGVLLGMTHMPSQQVYGWHQHRIGGGGFVESIAVIPENNEDVLYVAVRRTLAGSTNSVSIERLTPRVVATQADGYFVDGGFTYRGAPAITISGLWQLEGQAVQVLADGAVHPGRTVTSGAITLESPASVVHVGLGYVSDIQTLPQAYEQAPANGQGTMKNVSKVFVRVKDSSIVKAGPRFNALREFPARAVSDPYGSAPALRNGELSIAIDPSWTTDGSICLRQDLPLPLTVCALAHETAAGGG
jgi:hypothetical protein